jgi:hypothetical protein
MKRPTPKVYSGSGGFFSYYEVREMNLYLASKDEEIASLKRELGSLRSKL